MCWVSSRRHAPARLLTSSSTTVYVHLLRRIHLLHLLRQHHLHLLLRRLHHHHPSRRLPVAFLFSKMSTEQLRTVQYMEPLSLVRGDALVQQGEANARRTLSTREALKPVERPSTLRADAAPCAASCLPGSGRSDAPRSAPRQLGGTQPACASAGARDEESGYHPPLGMDVTVAKEGEAAPIVVAHLGASACLGEMALLELDLARSPPTPFRRHFDLPRQMALLYNSQRTATVTATCARARLCLSRCVRWIPTPRRHRHHRHLRYLRHLHHLRHLRHRRHLAVSSPRSYQLTLIEDGGGETGRATRAAARRRSRGSGAPPARRVAVRGGAGGTATRWARRCSLAALAPPP